MTITILSPNAGKIDDIRREDDDRGYERDETDQFQRLGTLLLRETDARIPTGRRAPRTLPEMRARINIAANQACQSCGGTGGQVVDTSSDGVSRQHWQTCQACGGSGVAR
ncbi:hypothetical protein [Streptomyces sp. NBC_01217]|uniref:hypothetical protein n=1 Tax=Streptomyces sp. NBC_01217 TaxID=2903779 RepID=UPI002E12166C|nr:hypothetical protein OG507_39875 [Streptomyces sp. NBC_01217]